MSQVAVVGPFDDLHVLGRDAFAPPPGLPAWQISERAPRRLKRPEEVKDGLAKVRCETRSHPTRELEVLPLVIANHQVIGNWWSPVCSRQ
jgi:hypothetical protein